MATTTQWRHMKACFKEQVEMKDHLFYQDLSMLVLKNIQLFGVETVMLYGAISI